MAAEKIKPYPLTKPKYSDKKKIIKQRVKGMTLQEIADNHGITKQSVCSLLQRVTNKDVLTAYTDKRSDIYAMIESDILGSIDSDDIKKASLLQRVTSAGILKTHERLERNQSTANIATAHGITPEMQELYDRITKKAKVEENVIEVQSEGQIEAGNG
jgi:predicted transcriptional regulator